MGHLRNLLVMIVGQFLSYSIVVYSWRAIAEKNVNKAVLVDIIYCTVQYHIIRKIANSKDSMWTWLGMVIGGCLGTYVGMII